MSKTLNQLKSAQEEYRNGNGNSSSEEKATVPRPYLNRILICGVILNLILSVSLFVMLKGYKSERNSTETKLNEIVELSNKNNNQINGFIADVKKLSEELGAANSKISQQEKNKESQQFAIETLTKAKNTLFNRMSELEAKIEQLNNKEVAK